MDQHANMSNATLIGGIESTNGTLRAGNDRTSTIFTPEIFIIYNTFLSIALVIGIIGNGLVLAIFAKHKATTSTEWFIIFITIFDFISSAFNVPVYLTFTTGHWRAIGTDIFCKIHYFVSQSVVLSSTFLICGLAIERYLKVCRRNYLTISKVRALHICVAITIVTTILSTPCFKVYSNDSGQCGTNSAVISWVFYYYLMVFFTYLLAFVVVVFAYTNISLVVIKSEKNVSRHGNVAQPQGISWYNWCCCCLYILGKKNKVIPISLVTNTSSDQSIPKERGDKEENIPTSTNGGTLSQSQTNGSTNIKCIATSDGVNIPSVQDSTTRLTSISGVRRQFDSNNAGTIETITTGQDTVERRYHENTRQRTRPHQGKRTTRITFAVCLIFIVSWIPPWVAFLLLSNPSMRVQPEALKFGLFGKMTFLFNTFLNPILYFAFNHKFQEQAVRFVCFWK